jgi:hypothetical protein
MGAKIFQEDMFLGPLLSSFLRVCSEKGRAVKLNVCHRAQDKNLKIILERSVAPAGK